MQAAAVRNDAKPAAVRTAVATVTPLPGVAQGIDISSNNAEPTWSTLKGSGISFVGIKATEGDYYVNETSTPGNSGPGYTAEATAATTAGLYVMPYAFANPYQGDAAENVTGNGSGTCQADYAWQEINSAATPASLTLPLVLDIEQDPYASTEVDSSQCYGLTPAQMTTWIGQFLTEAQKDTGKTPIVYTNPDFWADCTDNAALSGYPLWLADYGPASPPTVTGLSSPTFWQYTSTGSVSGATGDVDLNYLTPLTQSASVGTAVKPVQITTLSHLANPTQTAQYSATGLPLGLTISTAGVISGTPTWAGSFTVTVTVALSGGTSSTVTFIWDVAGAITFPPQASQSVTIGSPVNLKVNATDTNESVSGFTPPVFTATGLPPGVSISSGQIIGMTYPALLSGWPTIPGTYSVKVTAKDGLGAIATASFPWTVKLGGKGTTGAIRQNGGSGKCLDDPSGKTTTGTAIDLSTCTGKSNQAWTVMQDGTVRVLNHCIMASGKLVLLYPCDGSIADYWRAGTDGSLVDARYGTCLNGPTGAVANGNRPILTTCTNTTSSAAQHWSRPLAPIVSGVDGRCLTMLPPDGSTPPAEVTDCADTSAQHWLVAANAQIVVGSSNCLTVVPGSGIMVMKCANAATQHWRLVGAGGIADEIQEDTPSGLCLSVLVSGMDAAVNLSDCSTGLASTWRVTTGA
jgi:GH25 family lysozyme M1 (1,4-beta-N-acetylmuramidase)